jgi:hypothetical protein
LTAETALKHLASFAQHVMRVMANRLRQMNRQ